MSQESKSLPRWVVQLLAWGTGVGGLILDYGFGLFGTHNIPFLYYAICIGVGFGINPGFLVRLIIDGAAASVSRKERDKPREGDHE